MSAFLFCGLLFLLVISLNQKTAMMGISSQDIVISLLCCIGAGIALAINNIYAKKLSNSHFSPSEILTVRFFLIIIFSGVFTYKSIPLLFLWNNAVNIVIIAIMLIIIPQVILQYAIKGLQPITVSVIAPLMPVLTFFIEFFNKNLNPTVWSISGVFYIFVISAMAAIFRYRK
jgi:drug/metabolite transporter (DMT)-like permease